MFSCKFDKEYDITFKFYTMEHRGGLKESLETRIEITYEEYKKLLPLYHFYCYDERIDCDRYILNDMVSGHKNGYTTWLLKGIEV